MNFAVLSYVASTVFGVAKQFFGVYLFVCLSLCLFACLSVGDALVFVNCLDNHKNFVGGF